MGGQGVPHAQAAAGDLHVGEALAGRVPADFVDAGGKVLRPGLPRGVQIKGLQKGFDPLVFEGRPKADWEQLPADKELSGGLLPHPALGQVFLQGFLPAGGDFFVGVRGGQIHKGAS